MSSAHVGQESFLFCSAWRAKQKGHGCKSGRKEWQHLPCNTWDHPSWIILTDSAGMGARALLFLCLTAVRPITCSWRALETTAMIRDMLERLKELSWLQGWYKSPHSVTNEGLLCPYLGRKPESLFWYWNKAVPFQSSQESNCSFLRLSCTYAISLLSSFLHFCSLAPAVAGCVIASPECWPGKPSPSPEGEKAAQLSQLRHSYKWAAGSSHWRGGGKIHTAQIQLLKFNTPLIKHAETLLLCGKGREALVATASKGKGEMDKQKNTFSHKITISLNVITL